MNVAQYFRAKKRSSAALDYSSFEIIYSFRKLNPLYSGYAVELFRDSDGNISPFNFEGADLPEADILSWAGASTFRLHKIPNQGTKALRDLTFAAGTRAILGTAGAFNRVKGKIALNSKAASSRYESIDYPIAESIMNDHKVMSAVIETQSTSSVGTIFGESAFGAAGNNRNALISDTTATKIVFDCIVTGLYSTNLVAPAIATQNQQRIYSVLGFRNVPLSSDDGAAYWNNDLQQSRTMGRGWNPLSTTARLSLMGRSFNFLGQFQEVVFKTMGEDFAENEALKELVVAEQNLYYSVY